MHAFDRVIDYMQPDEKEEDEPDFWDCVDQAYDRWKGEESEWGN